MMVVEQDTASPDPQALDEAVRELHRRWEADGQVDLRPLVLDLPPQQRSATLVELIKVDQELRLRTGQFKRLEDYLNEWPELRDDAESLAALLEAECITRTVYDTAPSPDEVARRFPALADRLDWSAVEAEASEEAAGRELLRRGERFGRYEVRELIGVGGMGTVYRVYDAVLDREVALKLPHSFLPRRQHLAERFHREAPLAAKVTHPNLCTVYDAGQIDGRWYIAMQWVDGVSLAELIGQQPLAPHLALAVAGKLARALAAVHQHGILHRDIKPSNVMLDRLGEPLLMDFGLARRPTEESTGPGDAVAPPSPFDTSSTSFSLTHTGVVAGTPPYLAPEQLDGEPASVATDLYGLGVLFYQLLAGTVPFDPADYDGFDQWRQAVRTAPPPVASPAWKNIDERVRRVCLKALAKTPSERFATADDMAAALERTSAAVFPSAAPRAWRHYAFLGLLIAALVAVLAFFRTGYGTIAIVVDEPAVAVRLDGQPLEIVGNSATVPLPVGRHTVTVTKPGFRTIEETVEIRWRGHAAAVKADLQGEHIVERIPTALRLSAMALAADGQLLAVASSQYPDPSRIDLIDLPSGRVTRSIVEDDPEFDRKGVAFSPDGKRLFATNYFRGSLSIIPLERGQRAQELDLGARWPTYLGVTPDGKRLLAAAGADGRSSDENNDQIVVVDIEGATPKVVGRVKLDDEPRGRRFVFSDDGKRAYFVAYRRKSAADALYELSLVEPYRVLRKCAAPDATLVDLALATETSRIYLCDERHARLATVDIDSFQLGKPMALPSPARTIVLDRRQRALTAVLPNRRQALLLDPLVGTPLLEIAGLLREPILACFAKDDDRLLLGHGDPQGTVLIADLEAALLGERIAFASDRAGAGYQLYEMGADGRHVRPLLRSEGNDCVPRWSPDGRRVAFITDRNGPRQIMIARRDGSFAATLDKADPPRPERGDRMLDWSPDGRRIAYIDERRQDVRVVEVETGKMATLLSGGVEPDLTHHLTLTWRASDNQILLGSMSPASAHHHAIALLDPKTGKGRMLLDSRREAHRWVQPSVSPDGRRLVLVRCVNDDRVAPQPLFVADRDGGNRKLIAGTEATINFGPQWTADGKAIVYSVRHRDRGRLYRIAVEGGKPTPLTDGAGDDIDFDLWCERAALRQPMRK